MGNSYDNPNDDASCECRLFANKAAGTTAKYQNYLSHKRLGISDFVVTAPEFGAKAEPGFDNRAAFQAAIDAAYQSGGGVVYIPAGNYEFRSTQVGTKNVRVRQGRSETKKDFHFEYVLRLHLVCSFVVIGLIRHP